LTVFDSKLQLAITFAYELHFRRATTQNAQHEKFYRTNTRNAQKKAGKIEFLPSEVSDPKIPGDLHLYLALELFLSACLPRRDFISVLGSRL
jgi:hypothetical protein